jgi:hypothetical protein
VIEFDKDQRKVVLSVREYFKDKDKADFEEFRQKHQPKPVTFGDAFGTILGEQNAPTAPVETVNPSVDDVGASETPASEGDAEKQE